jgi:hypothetical protein
MIPIAGRRCLISLLLLGFSAPLSAIPGSWRLLGPDGGSSPGRLRFNVLAADPEDPCRIYAGTQSRGLLAFTESGTAQCP